MESAGTNDFGEPQFKVTVPADMTNIIFSDGGSAQTVDIPFDSSATGYYLTGWSDGKATVGTW